MIIFPPRIKEWSAQVSLFLFLLGTIMTSVAFMNSAIYIQDSIIQPWEVPFGRLKNLIHVPHSWTLSCIFPSTIFIFLYLYSSLVIGKLSYTTRSNALILISRSYYMNRHDVHQTQFHGIVIIVFQSRFQGSSLFHKRGGHPGIADPRKETLYGHIRMFIFWKHK